MRRERKSKADRAEMRDYDFYFTREGIGMAKSMARIYKSGLTAEISKFWAADNQKPRSSKTAKSSANKKDANGNQAIRQLARILNENFWRRDYLLTLHYDPEGLERVGGNRDEGDRKMMLFVQRMVGKYRKRGLICRYVAMTSEKSSRTLEKARLHHHIVVSGDLISKPERREEYLLAGKPISQAWGFGTVDCQQLRAEDDHTGLAVYLCRQAGCRANERRWHPSRNLRKPEWQDVELTREGIAEYNRHRRRGMPLLKLNADGKLVTPPKCSTLEDGAYIPAIGTHYLRFLMPEYRTAERTTEKRRRDLLPAIPAGRKGGGTA